MPPVLPHLTWFWNKSNGLSVIAVPVPIVFPLSFIRKLVVKFHFLCHWSNVGSSVVERWSLTGERSLVCTGPSVQSGDLPHVWKCASVTPVFKKDANRRSSGERELCILSSARPLVFFAFVSMLYFLPTITTLFTMSRLGESRLDATFWLLSVRLESVMWNLVTCNPPIRWVAQW